jgi:hypothetical protein
MSQLTREAEPAVEALTEHDADQLFTELGMRLETIQSDPSKSGQFNLVPDKSKEALGLMDEFRSIGQKYFNRVNVLAYGLVCGSDSENEKERNALLKSFELGSDAVGPALAAILVGHLGLAPAIAAVVAVLIVKLFFKPGYDTMCEYWKSKLP